MDHYVKNLEEAWDESGFFWQLRQGNFNYEAYHAYLSLLKQIEVDELATFEKRFVSLLWFVPVFMRWQTERVAKKGADMKAYSRAEEEIMEQLMRILGVP